VSEQTPARPVRSVEAVDPDQTGTLVGAGAGPGPDLGPGVGPGFGPALDVDAYRAVVSRFATGVTVATTRLDGLDHAMTINSFTSVSLEPVQVLICVEKESRFHDALLARGLWTVNVLDERGRAASSWFATRGRPLQGQLDQFAHGYSHITGAAVLEVAMAVLDVQTTAVHDGGDHSIVVGRVLSAWSRPGEATPLIYYRSRYRRLA
jgi:flavin reductase (DIM6/NTAB) family NADH-FMN oxidoreductase RutF